jgi:hypothetical protein
MKTRLGVLFGLAVVAGTSLPLLGFYLYCAVLPPPPLELPATALSEEVVSPDPWYARVFWSSESAGKKPWYELERWTYYEPWLYGVVMPWWAGLGVLTGGGILCLALMRKGSASGEAGASAGGRLRMWHFAVAVLVFLVLLVSPWVIAACVCSVSPKY